MKIPTSLPLLALLFSSGSHAACDSLLDFETTKLRSSETVNFCEAFSGKALLVVNTASKCGFTPQFRELQALYEKYRDQGLEIVGFPSDDFFQEHHDAAKTAEVCYINYGVSFTMVSTSPVRGSDANPFFRKLIEATGRKPSWNFNKYLIERDGRTVHHFGTTTSPMGGKLETAVQAALAKH